MVGLGQSLTGFGDNDMGRVPRTLHGEIFPASARHEKAWEFLELK